MKKPLIYLVLLSLFFACSQKESTTQAPVVEEVKKPVLNFNIETLNKVSKSCAVDSNSCATVDITVPQAVGTVAADPINARITGALVEGLSVGDVRTTGLSAAVDSFVDGYDVFLEEMKAEGQEFISSWAFEVEGNVLFQDSQYVTVELPFYTYTGGAHPNSFTVLLTFDATTGEEVDVHELIRNDTTSVKVLAKEAFIVARDLPPGAELQESGFFFGNVFTLPANIGITEGGLYLVYNPYEVAPYAAGSTEFLVPLPFGHRR